MYSEANARGCFAESFLSRLWSTQNAVRLRMQQSWLFEMSGVLRSHQHKARVTCESRCPSLGKAGTTVPAKAYSSAIPPPPSSPNFTLSTSQNHFNYQQPNDALPHPTSCFASPLCPSRQLSTNPNQEPSAFSTTPFSPRTPPPNHV